MTLGTKIKNARKAKHLTQEKLCKGKITRNMLSKIESDKANPSMDTIRFLATELSLPVAYFLSDDDDLLFYEKKAKMGKVYEALKNHEYEYCISTLEDFCAKDNETSFILGTSYFECGRTSLKRGSLVSALKLFELSERYCRQTAFDTSLILTLIGMYRPIAMNIQAPLLEFDNDVFKNALYDKTDFEFYKYLIQDYSYPFTNQIIKKHVDAKLQIKERAYLDAIRLLLDAIDIGIGTEYNAYIMFSMYSDLEICYKQLRDFENAYKYATKRMSMLEGFKS